MYVQIEFFFDVDICIMIYVVYVGFGMVCVVIDLVFDYDLKLGCMMICLVDCVVVFIEVQDLCVVWLLEMYVYVDYLLVVLYLWGCFGGCIVIGECICVVQGVFKLIFNFELLFLFDGLQFDYLFVFDEVFYIGNLEVKVLVVLGYMLVDMVYQVGDVVFVGDMLFMLDVGMVCCDFFGGNVGMLYQLICCLLDFLLCMQFYMCYDYLFVGCEVICYIMVVEQCCVNIYVCDGVIEVEFVQMCMKCDVMFGMFMLMLLVIQVNICVGMLFLVELNGVQYFKILLNVF